MSLDAHKTSGGRECVQKTTEPVAGRANWRSSAPGAGDVFKSAFHPVTRCALDRPTTARIVYASMAFARCSALEEELALVGVEGGLDLGEEVGVAGEGRV